MKNETIDYVLRLHGDDYSFMINAARSLDGDLLWAEQPGGVPIANIMCHVAEMERFWIDWGLCNMPFDRDRETEFTRRHDLTGDQIATRLEDRRALTCQRIANLSDDDWDLEREFHGDTFTGQGILVWHVHHVGLHRGHIQAHMRHMQ